MILIQLIVLALIQGLTEFLPVSSSAHLILGSQMFGWPDQGLAFDVATHLGTLLAVLVYFRKDLTEMVMVWLHPANSDSSQQKRTLGSVLLLASLPALLVGYLAADWIEGNLRDLRIVAITTIVFGLLLWLADKICPRHRDLSSINMPRGLLIGLTQVLALVPGTSRSGITITAGRALGLGADAAARFSFLLSIPVIAAAGGYGAIKVAQNSAGINWSEFFLAVGLSALAGWLCIAVFLKLLKKVGLLPFILYRLALGLVLVFLLF